MPRPKTMTTKSGVVRQKLGGKTSVKVKGEWYDWNSAYKVYNRRRDYEQLRWSDVLEALK